MAPMRSPGGGSRGPVRTKLDGTKPLCSSPRKLFSSTMPVLPASRIAFSQPFMGSIIPKRLISDNLDRSNVMPPTVKPWERTGSAMNPRRKSNDIGQFMTVGMPRG